MSRRRMAWRLILSGLAIVLVCAPGWANNAHEIIPPYTPELDARLKAPPQPLLAVYRLNDEALAFVGAAHVFTPQNSTLTAVDEAFLDISPALVILEGFPTVMGENPPPLVEEAGRRGAPDADDYVRGEDMYAATLALARHIPFIGGEPSRQEQLQDSLAQGYRLDELSFNHLLGGIAQSVRAGRVSGHEVLRLRDIFDEWHDSDVKDWHLPAMRFEDFLSRYRRVFGVELQRDPALAQRVGPPPEHPTQAPQGPTVLRDQHLIKLIDQMLASKKRVVVVFGSNHWVSLAEALERRLGKPKRLESFERSGAHGGA